MMIAFRTNVEVLLDDAFIQHVLADRTAHPQALGHFFPGLERKTVPLRFGLFRHINL